VLGADDTVARRRGRQSTATGCDRDAVRSTHKPVMRCLGLTGVAMMRLGPVPWRRRVWAWPLLTARCWPATQRGTRRHQTSVAWVRQMRTPGRRGLPGRRLVLGVDGGLGAVWLALAGVKSRRVLVSRVRWEAARYHPPGWPPQGPRGPKPPQGKRHRRLQSWAARPAPPWEDVEVDCSGGHRKQWWVFSRTALWDTPGLPPGASRAVVVADPAGKLRLDACCCPDLQATPEQLGAWVVMRRSVAVTCEAARTPRGLETPRPWSALALHWSGDGQIPVPVTAWSHQDEPTCSDGLALVRPHRWRAQYSVHSTLQGACLQFLHAALDLLIHGVLFAA
jgi:hypothetical protein